MIQTQKKRTAGKELKICRNIFVENDIPIHRTLFIQAYSKKNRDTPCYYIDFIRAVDYHTHNSSVLMICPIFSDWHTG